MPSERGGGRLAAIGRGASDATEVDVACRGQHINVVCAATGVGTVIHGVEVSLEDGKHYVVGDIVIVAKLGCAIEELLLQPLVPGKVSGKGRQQSLHCPGFFIINVKFECG